MYCTRITKPHKIILFSVSNAQFSSTKNRFGLFLENDHSWKGTILRSQLFLENEYISGSNETLMNFFGQYNDDEDVYNFFQEQSKNGTWAEQIILDATAWLLKHDIWHCGTDSYCVWHYVFMTCVFMNT